MSEASQPAETTMGQPVTQASFTVYVGPPLESIKRMVASQFHVKDAFLDPYGVPTVLVAAEPPKEKFSGLLRDLAQQQLVAAIRGSGDTLTIKVFQKQQRKPARFWINIILFLATVLTVFAAGYLWWTVFAGVVSPSANSFLKAGEFAGGLLAIIGLHEMGHQVAARHHKLDATFPYFIPGPPPVIPWGTFGAVISLREPPANRDQLFDLGVSGPLVGFAVTVVVGIVGIFLGLALTQGQVNTLLSQGLFSYRSWPNEPLISTLLFSDLQGVIRPDTILYSQLFIAVQIGALLTFLNLIPAWQLDGGHIWRAAFGAEGHRIATMIGIGALFVPVFFGYEQYVGFAILLLLFISFSRRGLAGVEPLDDVSPLSNSRKLVFLAALVTLFLCFSFF